MPHERERVDVEENKPRSHWLNPYVALSPQVDETFRECDSDAGEHAEVSYPCWVGLGLLW